MTGSIYKTPDDREVLSRVIEKQLSEAVKLNDLRSQLGRLPQSPRILRMQEDIDCWFTDVLSLTGAPLDNLSKKKSSSAPKLEITEDEFTARLLQALQTSDPYRRKALRKVLMQLLDEG